MSRSRLKNKGYFVKNVCEKCGSEIVVHTKPPNMRRLTKPLKKQRRPRKK